MGNSAGVVLASEIEGYTERDSRVTTDKTATIDRINNNNNNNKNNENDKNGMKLKPLSLSSLSSEEEERLVDALSQVYLEDPLRYDRLFASVQKVSIYLFTKLFI